MASGNIKIMSNHPTEAQLVLPSADYKQSFVQANKDRMLTSTNPDWLRHEIEDFDHYLAYTKTMRTLENPPKGTPQTIYWLIDRGHYVGEIHIRHRPSGKIPNHIYYDIAPAERNKGYGTLILHLGLPKAKALGLNKVFLTCNTANIASKKVIEANGGVVEKTVVGGDTTTLLYSISLTN